MKSKRSIQELLALLIISPFLFVTTVLAIFAAFGITSLDNVKEIYQIYTGIYSFLIGAVVGYYFRSINSGKLNYGIED